jgi:hypothetical protein
VSAAADREQELVVASEIDAGDDVGRVDGPGDEGRTTIDHGVVDLASFVVLAVVWRDEPSAESGFELLWVELAGHGGSPSCRVVIGLPRRALGTPGPCPFRALTGTL